MRLPLPLYVRMLCWFFLNLGLVAVAFWVVLRWEYRLEPMLADLARERVAPVAESLVGELRERPRESWAATLERFGAAYGIQFLLVRDDGTVVAGPAVAIPEAVRQRLRPVGLGPGGGSGNGPGAGPRGGLPGDGPPGLREEAESDRRGGPPPNRRRPQGMPPQFVHTREPDQYWFITMAGVGELAERRPLRLVLVSRTLAAGGLFFDVRPWIWAGVGVLVLSVLWWIPFVRGITRTLSRLTRSTEAIAEGRFDLPPASGRGDELGRLDEAIRQMASRLEGYVHGQKRFLGDIAHELCSPLARMEMALGVLEQRADERQREYVSDVREEVRQMSALVNELLSFSKAGLRGREVVLEAVEIEPLLRRVVRAEAVDDSKVRLEVPAGLRAMAAPDLLARAVGNLLRNAVRHGGDAGPVELVAAVVGDTVRVRVMDGGPGVPAEAVAKLGQPFYRPDEARTREAGGVGLGLAIVRTCAEACQGGVEFRNRQPRGFEAEIRLRRI